MSKIPKNIQELPKIKRIGRSVEEYLLSTCGMSLQHRGKVRDTYVSDDLPDKLVVVATDRLSIFDFVLPVTIPYKGEVLTALTHFWLTHILYQWRSHLVGVEVNPPINAAFDLQFKYGMVFPLERTLVVWRYQMQPYELIFRYHLGGTVWKSYTDTGKVSGVELRKGMTRWQRLDPPLFTPSTKEIAGHDKNITIDEYYTAVGPHSRRLVFLLKQMYEFAYAYALKCGIVILDTKFEVSVTLHNG